MKRKEALRLLDEIGHCVTGISADCKVNGKDFDLSQIQAGLATGIAYAKGKLYDDAEYPDSIKEESSDLCIAALEVYLQFFKEEDKCSSK